jgi:hypothetical protein
VIHGTVFLPIPLEMRLLPNKTENPCLPKQIAAHMGDIIEIGNEDAMRMLDTGVIEPESVAPAESKLGKGCVLEQVPPGKTISWDYVACEQFRATGKLPEPKAAPISPVAQYFDGRPPGPTGWK